MEEQGNHSQQQAKVDHAKRKLIKIGAYAAPAIIGSLLTSKQAFAAGSCNPDNCNPSTNCDPNDGSGCNPDTCNPATCKPATK